MSLNALFRHAVAAVDAGDVATLERALAEHPILLRERLEEPGPWLREQVGQALDDFFARPYLLWFVAEDPVRNGTLPRNVAQVARTILQAAERERVASLQEQVDHALKLVSWSWIARECGVQIELIDVLLAAGASPAGNPENALVNGNREAAAHLVARGAPLSLATALCLGRLEDAARLAPAASAGEKQFGCVLAALDGNAEAVARALSLGADANLPSERLYAHGTPLHHAVCSGSLDTVRVLVEAGAGLRAVDTLWKGTPLGWAEHYRNQHAHDERGARFAEVVTYLKEKGG